MLWEYTKVNQIEGEPRRRWFADDFFDLIVWFDESEDIVGFQLCCDKSRQEKALTWLKHSGHIHDLARTFHDSATPTVNMIVLPGVLVNRPLRLTVQLRLGFDSLRFPGGTLIFTVSRRRIMKCPE